MNKSKINLFRSFKRPFALMMILLLSVANGVLGQSIPPAPSPSGPCGPMDVAFVMDLTGSMGGAIDGVKRGIAPLIDLIVRQSGNDYRLALVTFPDDVVTVEENLAFRNGDRIQARIAQAFVTGGGGEPECSDEALNTVINILSAEGRNQVGNYTEAFRPEARKIIILITDARPAGFDDTFTEVDDENSRLRAEEARGMGINISAVDIPSPLFSPEIDAQKAQIMRRYAELTGGLYALTQPEGGGIENILLDIINSCGISGIPPGSGTPPGGGTPPPGGGTPPGGGGTTPGSGGGGTTPGGGGTPPGGGGGTPPSGGGTPPSGGGTSPGGGGTPTGGGRGGGTSPLPFRHLVCGDPMDVVFVIDTGERMAIPLEAVKGGIRNLIYSRISRISNNNYRLALVTFKDDVRVEENFFPVFGPNGPSIISRIDALVAEGGGDEPQASDEALNTAINILSAEGRPQTGDFTEDFRPEARKIIILITNARPGGFDDAFTEEDDENFRLRALEARNKGIEISVLDIPSPDPDLGPEIDAQKAPIYMRHVELTSSYGSYVGSCCIRTPDDIYSIAIAIEYYLILDPCGTAPLAVLHRNRLWANSAGRWVWTPSNG